jgi:hypothetical protein
MILALIRINCGIFSEIGQAVFESIAHTHTNIQGVIEMRDQILTTSYWLYVELEKNI